MQHKCKITVIHRPFFPDVSVMSYGKEIGPCDFYHDGQEFIVDEENYRRMLDGDFCGEAWDCIKRYVYTALHGGTMIGMDSYIACCNDACRPVMFKIERIDEGDRLWHTTVNVKKRTYHDDLAKEYAPKTITGPCMQFSAGQEFILDQNSLSGFWHLMGGTFCSEAWTAISHYVDTILQGGVFITDSG